MGFSADLKAVSGRDAVEILKMEKPKPAECHMLYQMGNPPPPQEGCGATGTSSTADILFMSTPK